MLLWILALGMCPKRMLLYWENYVSLQLQPSEGMDQFLRGILK